MDIYHLMPPELWPIVGSYLYMDVSPYKGSLLLTIKPAEHFVILYPTDEAGEGFVQPCLIS